MDKNEIKHLAKLSFIEVDEHEEKQFVLQLNEIFMHIENTIKNVKLDSILENGITKRYIDLFHEDNVVEEFTRDRILFNTLKEKNGFILVPKIIKEED